MPSHVFISHSSKYQAGDGKSDELRAGGNAPVAEQRITKGQVHTSLVRAGHGASVQSKRETPFAKRLHRPY